MKIEKGEDMHGLFCFNLITEGNTYMVAATTQVERSKWMEVLGRICTVLVRMSSRKIKIFYKRQSPYYFPFWHN